MKDLIRTRVEYDKEADAIYIHFLGGIYSYGKDIDNERRIDYDNNGQPIGIELLCVSEGVILDDLPYPVEVEKILIENNIRAYA
jgi:uncharacterized protein YuzE